MEARRQCRHRREPHCLLAVHGAAIVEGHRVALPQMRGDRRHGYPADLSAFGAAVRPPLHGGCGNRALTLLRHRQLRLRHKRYVLGDGDTSVYIAVISAINALGRPN